MSDRRYRVGVIGRTGKGNYGHGLDVVVMALYESQRSGGRVSFPLKRREQPLSA